MLPASDRPGPRFITIAAAAEMMSLSVSGARKMAARGLLPLVHVGRLVRVDLRRLEATLDAQAQGQHGGGR